MPKSIISILLTLIFVGFLTAPTIIKLIDNSADISIFYTTSSPEEEKGADKKIDVEVLFNTIYMANLDFTSIKKGNNSDFYFKNYPNPHLNLISPPPELHIL
jgi:hypothetical protein